MVWAWARSMTKRESCGDCLTVVSRKPTTSCWLALVADGVEGGLLGGGGVLGEGAEEGDVLGLSAFVVVEGGKGGDEAAAEEGDVVFSVVAA